jgi:hypothetical protein
LLRGHFGTLAQACALSPGPPDYGINDPNDARSEQSIEHEESPKRAALTIGAVPVGEISSERTTEGRQGDQKDDDLGRTTHSGKA